jgi:tape measure domain-containing protein
MTETASLSIRVTQEGVDSTASALGRLSQAGSGAENSFGNLALKIAGFSSLTNLAVDAGRKAVSMVVDLGKESVTLAASFEKSRVTWGVLVGDMEKGSQVFDKLRSFANTTPLSFEAVNQAATTLKGFGVQTNDLVGVMGKLGDVAMGDNNKLQSLALVYGQVMAQGKAKTQDLYQFINAGVPIFALLSQSMGVSSGEIKDLAADSKITFDEIEKALTKATDAGGQFYNMMDKTAETTAGKWSTAMDNWKTILGDIGTTTLPFLNRMLDDFNAKAEKAASKANLAKVLSGQGGDVDTAVADTFDELQSERAKLADPGLYGDQRARQENIIRRLEARYNALAQAQYQASMKATGASSSAMGGGGEPPAPPVSPESPYFFTSDFWNVPADIRGGPSLTEAERLGRYYSSGDYTAEQMRIAGMGAVPSASYGQESTATPYSDVSITDLARRAQGFKSVEDAAEKAANAEKRFQTAMTTLGQGFEDIAKDAYVESFKAIGEALASGSDGAASFSESMADIGTQILNSMPQMLLQAGLQACMSNHWELGLALIGASGLVAIGAGMANASDSSSSNTDEINSNLAQYYLNAEAFNQNGRASASLTGYAHGGIPTLPGFSAYRNQVVTSPHFFGFAAGGVFGEVPGAAEAAVPLVRTRSGNLGVETTGSGGTVVNVHNYLGEAEVTQQETVDASGLKTVDVYLNRKVDSRIARKTASQGYRRISG